MKSNYNAVGGHSLERGKAWLQSLQPQHTLAEAQDRTCEFMTREIDKRIAEREWTPEEMGEFVSTLPLELSAKFRDALTGWMTRHLPIDLSDDLDTIAATMEWQPEVKEAYSSSAPRF